MKAVGVLVVGMAVVLAACGPKATTVAEPEKPGAGTGTGTETDGGVEESAKDPLAAAVEQIVALYEAIATLPPASSCGEAATSIETWIAERQDALVQVRDAAQGPQAPLVDGLFHDASPRLTASLRAVDQLATRCASEPAVNAALARLSTEAPR